MLSCRIANQNFLWNRKRGNHKIVSKTFFNFKFVRSKTDNLKSQIKHDLRGGLKDR